MKSTILIAGMIITLLFLINNASSATITYIYTGHGSGDLGGVPFFNEDFTISATGNTADRENHGAGIFSINNSTATINISDVGNLTISSPTRLFVNNLENTVGFSHAGFGGLDLFNTVNPAFGSWKMMNSIGPVDGIGKLIQWDGFGTDPDLDLVMTSEGILSFNDSFDVAATFQATVSPIPEPSTYALLLVGLGVMGFLARVRA